MIKDKSDGQLKMRPHLAQVIQVLGRPFSRRIEIPGVEGNETIQLTLAEEGEMREMEDLELARMVRATIRIQKL